MSFIIGLGELSDAIEDDKVDYLKVRLSINEIHKTRFASAYGNGITLLEYACTCEAYKCIDYLIEMGVDINEVTGPTRYRSSALLSAVKSKNAKCTEILLKAGADPNLLMPLNHIMIIGITGCRDIPRMLVIYGADASFIPKDYSLRDMWEELCMLRKQVEIICLCARPLRGGGSMLHGNILRTIARHLWSTRGSVEKTLGKIVEF